MDPVAAKMIGAGIACIGMGGAGIGVGHIFGNFLSGALRNPAAAGRIFPNMMLGFALTESVALFALVIAFLLIFAV